MEFASLATIAWFAPASTTAGGDRCRTIGDAHDAHLRHDFMVGLAGTVVASSALTFAKCSSTQRVTAALSRSLPQGAGMRSGTAAAGSIVISEIAPANVRAQRMNASM